jgi:hypothetical protein
LRLLCPWVRSLSFGCDAYFLFFFYFSCVTITSKLAGNKVKVNPKDLPEVVVGERALIVGVTAAANALDLVLFQHLSIVCPRCQQ